MGGTFLLCSLWASFNLFFSLTSLRQSDHPPDNPVRGASMLHRRPKRPRPPLWPLLVLPVVMSFVAALVALISGSVIGFALAAVYSAGGFTMST
jgi:hypothetical protein